MQPRTLDQIISSLGSVYDPQVRSIQEQQAAVPGQITSQEQGLQAKQDTAFGDILGGARRRGLGFSGIPLQEQARYTADTYLPALANLRTAGVQQQQSLTDAINQINERRATQGQSIYQYETTLAEQQREFDAQQAAQARAAAASNTFNPSYGDSALPAVVGNPKSASAIQRKDGGFNYTDAGGRPISAAAYAAAKGIAFRDLLAQAAKAGDKGSQTALGFVGNDFGYDPRKITNPALASLYNSLVWGTGKSASVKPAVAAQPPAPVYQPPNAAGFLGINNPLALRR